MFFARFQGQQAMHVSLLPFLIRWFVVAVGLLLLIALTPLPLAAQGTPQQRAACEQEARWICSNYIPDVDQITACMVRNRHLLSPRCRAMFGGPTKQRRPRGN
jgi:hypothetical protein